MYIIRFLCFRHARMHQMCAHASDVRARIRHARTHQTCAHAPDIRAHIRHVICGHVLIYDTRTHLTYALNSDIRTCAHASDMCAYIGRARTQQICVLASDACAHGSGASHQVHAVSHFTSWLTTFCCQ